MISSILVPILGTMTLLSGLLAHPAPPPPVQVLPTVVIHGSRAPESAFAALAADARDDLQLRVTSLHPYQHVAKAPSARPVSEWLLARAGGDDNTSCKHCS